MSLPAARTGRRVCDQEADEFGRTGQWDDEVSRSMTKDGIEPLDQELSRTLELSSEWTPIRKAMSECQEESKVVNLREASVEILPPTPYG